MVAEGLRAMLEPHVGQVTLSGGEGPIDANDAVDAVVFDLSSLRVWGRESLGAAIASAPVLAVETRGSASSDGVDARDRARALGVRELLGADIDGGDLLAAVRRAAGRAGGLPGVVSQELPRSRPASDAAAAAAATVAPLTHRESQVVALAARGLTNVEIGEQLYLSINSVKTYLRTAFRRIEVANRAEAAAWLTEHAAPPRS